MAVAAAAPAVRERELVPVPVPVAAVPAVAAAVSVTASVSSARPGASADGSPVDWDEQPLDQVASPPDHADAPSLRQASESDSESERVEEHNRSIRARGGLHTTTDERTAAVLDAVVGADAGAVLGAVSADAVSADDVEPAIAVVVADFRPVRPGRACACTTEGELVHAIEHVRKVSQTEIGETDPSGEAPVAAAAAAVVAVVAVVGAAEPKRSGRDTTSDELISKPDSADEPESAAADAVTAAFADAATAVSAGVELTESADAELTESADAVLSGFVAAGDVQQQSAGAQTTADHLGVEDRSHSDSQAHLHSACPSSQPKKRQQHP